MAKPLRFIKSQRGCDMLLFNGFLHNRERKIGEKTTWKCAGSYNRLKCPGRVHTRHNEAIKFVPHNHGPDLERTKLKIAMNSIKERAKRMEKSTKDIIASVCGKLPKATAAKMPQMTSLKRIIQRIRRPEDPNQMPPPPLNLTELHIPPLYTETNLGKPFLMYDSGPGEKRILIFSTTDNLEMMATFNHWFADGKFKRAPHLFGQLFTIHIVRCGDIIPMVYALLPDKTEETYVKFLQQLKILRPRLQPKTITTDFEVPAINALQQEFPSSRFQGSLIHFTQFLSTVIQSSGLQHICKDPDFILNLKRLAALSYIPEEDVVAAFEQLLDFDFFVQNESTLIPLLYKFEDTYIGRYDRRGYRRPPLLPLVMWNCYRGVKEDLQWTNDAAEEWHNGFNRKVTNAHRDFWKLIRVLKKEENFNRLKIEQLISGNQPQKAKYYREKFEIIKEIVNRYEETPLFDYLTDIAHNIRLQ